MALADVAADIVEYQGREVTTVGRDLGDSDAPQLWPMFTAYAAAKTALVRLTETLAIETARDGIRV
jgi:NAD(P)-dependent dehydrogenase (short-subunit alcohol dehydrogenase family)